MSHKKESQEHNKISQYFLFPTVVSLSLILLFYFFMSTSFLQQIFGEKLLLILKLCIKKKNNKRQYKKIVCETVIFGSPNLTILKKKSKNTKKYHNIFTIPFFFRIRINIFFILFERNATTFITFLEKIHDKLLLVLN